VCVTVKTCSVAVDDAAAPMQGSRRKRKPQLRPAQLASAVT
jgi:hypothetical protein